MKQLFSPFLLWNNAIESLGEIVISPWMSLWESFTQMFCRVCNFNPSFSCVTPKNKSKFPADRLYLPWLFELSMTSDVVLLRLEGGAFSCLDLLCFLQWFKSAKEKTSNPLPFFGGFDGNNNPFRSANYFLTVWSFCNKIKLVQAMTGFGCATERKIQLPKSIL